MKLLLILIFFSFYSFSEAFGNKIISLPNIGIDFIDSFSKKELNISRQYNIGTSFSYALSYDWYFLSKTQIGFASLKNHDDLLTSLKTFLGASYLFGISDVRFFSSILLGYWQFLGANAKKISNLKGWPILVGPRAEAGLEWIFIDEFSTKILTHGDIYININKIFTYALGLEISFSMYF